MNGSIYIFILKNETGGIYAENRWQTRGRIYLLKWKDSSMQHILVHDNLIVFWIFIQF